MSYSYPIWHNVSACHYKTDKSFGGKNTSVDNIDVGSSPKNSYRLVNSITTRRFEIHPVYGKICIFRYSVDGIIVKEMIFKDNKGKAGEFIKKRSALKRMKGL